MIRLSLGANDGPLRILCLGAHSDDIEIGCGGTILKLLRDHPGSRVSWIVLSGDEERAVEARTSAADFLAAAGEASVAIHEFRDGYFPSDYAGIKQTIEAARRSFEPEVIFTHYRQDGHQDHRTVAELTYTVFRKHLVLEYEIPKYDGDAGNPNFFVPVATDLRTRKVDCLMRHFGTQRHRSWFTPETFDGLMRLRGIQSGAEEGYAEGFYCRRMLV